MSKRQGEEKGCGVMHVYEENEMEAFYFILAQTKGNCALESQSKNELTLISSLQYDNHFFPMKEKALR